MTGSEADTERELEEDESGNAESMKLAEFLTPVPRPKSSLPPPPPAAALKPAPTPVIARERTSLFSDLPIPRKNSSLRPPAAVTETPRTEGAAPAPRDDSSAPLGGVDEIESPTENVALEESSAEESHDDDLDVIPMSHAPVGRAGARRVAAVAAVLIAVAGVVFVLKRATRGERSQPASATAESAAEPRAPRAPTDETLEPTNDLAVEPSAADPAKARDLRREARRLLEAGNAEEGVQLSRRAIQADPNDPEGYILLAAGLQDLGRWQESRDVFAKCVQESSRKANAECVYFATRSK
jgi:hypothetical protein